VENFWDDFAYRFFFLAATADLVGLAPMRPTGRFDFATDGSRPRSKATSSSALIQTRSGSGTDESFADISPKAPRFIEPFGRSLVNSSAAST
jgi:hypothetical protein